MTRKIALMLAAIVLGYCSSAGADELLLEQIYGSGVHAFFQGDYRGAYTSFTAAIKGGSNDPRAFYFRGLTFTHLGRDQEARADFQAGAELEVADSSNTYPVNRSLERVQGSARQSLEQYRTMVHAAAVQKHEEAMRARYQERVAAEREVLRKTPPPQLPGNSSDITTPGSATPKNGGEENPFGGNEPVMPKPKPPVGEPITPAGNPFEGDGGPAKAAVPTPGVPLQGVPTPTPPAPKPAPDDNPFGGDTAVPAPTMPTNPGPTNPGAGAPGGGSPLPGDSGAAAPVQPTPGGFSSITKALARGLQGEPDLNGPMEAPPLGDLIRGLIGGPPGGMPPGGMPPGGTVPPPGMVPPGMQPGDNVPPPTGNVPPSAGAVPPPTEGNPFGDAVPQPNPTTPPQGGTMVPAPMPGDATTTPQPTPGNAAGNDVPAPTTPPQTTPPATAPKDSGNPFDN